MKQTALAALLLGIPLVSMAAVGPAPTGGTGGIGVYAENPFYWEYQRKPVLLLGGSSAPKGGLNDEGMFLWPDVAGSLVVLCHLFLASTALVMGADREPQTLTNADWFRRLLDFPYKDTLPTEPVLQMVRQDFEQLERNRSVIRTPLKIGGRSFAHGLGTHSISHLRVQSPEPIDRFDGWVGVDANERTAGGQGSVIFSVEVALHGLDAEKDYLLTFDSSGEKRRVRGADLMKNLLLTIEQRPGSESITYQLAQL